MYVVWEINQYSSFVLCQCHMTPYQCDHMSVTWLHHFVVVWLDDSDHVTLNLITDNIGQAHDSSQYCSMMLYMDQHLQYFWKSVKMVKTINCSSYIQVNIGNWQNLQSSTLHLTSGWVHNKQRMIMKYYLRKLFNTTLKKFCILHPNWYVLYIVFWYLNFKY